MKNLLTILLVAFLLLLPSLSLASPVPDAVQALQGTWRGEWVSNYSNKTLRLTISEPRFLTDFVKEAPQRLPDELVTGMQGRRVGDIYVAPCLVDVTTKKGTWEQQKVMMLIFVEDGKTHFELRFRALGTDNSSGHMYDLSGELISPSQLKGIGIYRFKDGAKSSFILKREK